MNSLFRRYVGALSGLVAASIVLTGTALAFYHYLQDSRWTEQVQVAQARAASASIQEYLRGIERTLESLTRRGQEGTVLGRDPQATDFREALKFQSAILNIRAVDSRFRETNFVSRIVPDRIESLQEVPWVRDISRGCASEFCYGAAFIRDETEPYVSIVVRPQGAEGESIVAEISLRFIGDVLTQLPIDQLSQAYVVDLRGKLVAHPDLRTLLQRSDVSGLAQFQKVTLALREGRQPLPSIWGESPAGGDVFTSAAQIPGPGWLVFVEQPARNVLRVVHATIAGTLLLLAVGLVAAVAASMLLAQRLARPIMLLRDGAERFGGGDLSARIDIRTRDEIESVATAFNQMADSLRTLYASLEAKVAARTEELAEANARITAQARQVTGLNSQLELRVHELGLKREEADRANAAKTRFLAAASHDLRQPMHAIGLLIGILADRMASPEVAPLMDKIQLSVAALEGLFSALLDVSKLDAGAVHPSIAPVELDAVLRSVEVAHAQEASKKGLRLRVAECRTMVATDEALLLGLLNNLVSNAIRYTERGHVDVFCRKRGKSIDISVADSGIGIAHDQLEKVFEEFYQVADTERDRSEGLGLGLAIVRRTAELLGHPLIVRSAVGKGSVFGVRVNIAGTRMIRRVDSAPTSSREPVIAGSFVVVVDDDPENRFATEAIFESWDCHVICGASGNEIIEGLTSHLRQPDLIVADYWLRGGATGLDVVRQLRAVEEVDVPAIILTGDHEVAREGLGKTGGVVFLQKPVNPQRLKRATIDLLLAYRAEAGRETLSE